jgi:PAS domain S-box-containing protein
MLTESIPQMVWTANVDDSLAFANSRWFEYTGLTLENAQRLGWEALVHPDDQQRSWAEWKRASESQTFFEIEHRMKRAADQAYRWHLSRAIPMLEDAKRVSKWFGTSTDIEDRIRAEKAVLQKQKLESIGILAGGIAHDFNNLLCGILGGASFVAQSLPSSHPVQPMLATVVCASERAAQLTRQMLAYAGKGAFLIQHVDLCNLVRDTCSLLHASVPKSVHLKLQLSHDLPAIETDPGQMQQVVMNLVINAAESIAEGQGGVVVVQTTSQEITSGFIEDNNLASAGIVPGTHVVLDVEDTGCGMDGETRARMFDPFFTTKFTGRGLGLAAVQGIVSTNKGAIQVISGLGRGTKIQVFIPASRSGLEKLSVPPVDSPIEAAGTIAIIDDEDLVRHVAQAGLTRSGYRVLVAGNGEESLELLQQNQHEIKLLILDMSMPGMSGRDVLEQIRKLNIEVPVAISSGHNEEEVFRHFSGLGICGVIQKPYTMKALTEKVASLLNPTRP